MKQNKRMSMGAVWVACLCLLVQAASANNLKVANVSLVAGDTGYSYVQADISWDNSWKASWGENAVTITNWDAAWFFVKFRTVGVTTGAWSHASLSTNASDHVCTNTATINVGVSTNAGTPFGCGVFLYRSAEGHGAWTNTVKLRWNYAADGLSTASKVDVNVLGIEMVYVPQGSFYVGDGATGYGNFCSNTAHTTVFPITGEGELNLGGGAGGGLNRSMTYQNLVDDFNDGTNKSLSADFPKGYNAFYCMKYEMSEGQWVSFFNMLTDTQKGTRDITSNVNGGKNSDGVVARNTVAWTAGDATTAAPDRACGYLSWADGAAYADWAGLRPMTELELEKACRGPLTPVGGEYAWGTATYAAMNTNDANSGFSGTDGSGTETVTGSKNCIFGASFWSGLPGPARCGIFAASGAGRVLSGATYWGIMEMSGNLDEKEVNVGTTTGRSFTGAVGDGRLNATGDADAANWPGTSAQGSGLRGGNYWENGNGNTLSLRVNANYSPASSGRGGAVGFRAVRQMP